MSRDGPGTGILPLAGLILGAAALGAALWWLGGPPQVPSALPDWHRIGQILAGSHLPNADVIYVAKGLGWLALSYLAATLVLRVTGQALVRLTDGAAWARASLRLSDAVTIPVVRRVVDGAVAGTLVLAVWLRAGPTTEVAASAGSSVVAMAAPAGPVPMLEWAGAASGEPVSEDVNGAGMADRFVSYTVVQGDNLWDISRRFYGDGTLYTVIFRANEGHVMTTGEAFTNPRLIRPRWVLDVPMPGYNVWDAGDHLMYRVRPDDSLWRIAESFLDDALRWTEIWDLNQGREMGGGRRFMDPSLILPGWVLELPVEATVAAHEPSTESTEATAARMPSPTPEPSFVPEPETQTAPQPEAMVVPELEPTVAPVQQPSRDGGGSIDWPRPDVAPVLATAAGLAAAGGVALLVRHLARRRSERVLASGGNGRGKAAVRGDVGRVVLAARALMRGLAERGFDDLRLVLAREAERYLEFTLDCSPGDAEAVLGSRYDLGRRLACGVDAEVVGPTRIRLKLSRFQRLAGLLVDEGAEDEPLLLVPTGAAENGVYYLNLAAAGSAIVVGSQHEAGKLLSAWLTTLAALYPPERVAFVAAGAVGSLVGDAASLPHFALPAREGNERLLEELATELEETIVAREAASSQGRQRVAVVAMAALSGEWKAEVDRLETALHRGPESGISIVCVADDVNETRDLNAFGARLVFGPLGEGSAASAAGPDELTLAMGRDAPLTLRAVGVRSEVLRPRTDPERHADFEGLTSAPQEERSVAPKNWPEPPPQSEDLTPEDVTEAPDDQPEEPSLDVDSEEQPAMEDAKAALEPNGHASRQETLLLAEEDAPGEEGTDTGSAVFGVRCFGSFEVRANGREISRWKVQKARELLAYLIARGGTAVLRDEVAEALWPDGDPAQVQHHLSNAAYYLRRAMKNALPGTDVQVFVASGQRYHLRTGVLRVDVDAFDAHLRRAEALEGLEALAEYERALAFYQGDFLGNEPFEWAEAYRREYQRRFLAATHQAARLAVESRDVEKAMELYRAILASDPIDEEAARGLMCCYARLGDVNGARKVYKVLTESLRRELEDEKAQPLPETTALLQEFTQQPKGP